MDSAAEGPIVSQLAVMTYVETLVQEHSDIDKELISKDRAPTQRRLRSRATSQILS